MALVWLSRLPVTPWGAVTVVLTADGCSWWCSVSNINNRRLRETKERRMQAEKKQTVLLVHSPFTSLVGGHGQRRGSRRVVSPAPRTRRPLHAHLFPSRGQSQAEVPRRPPHHPQPAGPQPSPSAVTRMAQTHVVNGWRSFHDVFPCFLFASSSSLSISPVVCKADGSLLPRARGAELKT